MASDDLYFSDRELGPKPRTIEEISQKVWGGIVAAVNSRISDGSFGYKYPDECPDGAGVCGCNDISFNDAIAAEIPDISLPLISGETPPTLAILDMIEFCYRNVAKPMQIDYHSFFRHHHLRFEPEEGQEAFRNDINRIFSRNGLAYNVQDNGKIVRLAPEGLRQDLSAATFWTGDRDLDSLLESARIKFLSPDPSVRRESLEKMWDAWERIKTIEPGADKKASINAMLVRVAPEPNFRERLDQEARELTSIGNNFRIRHSETSQTPLQIDEHVDYLFHRMFSLIRLMLKVTHRGG
jgi:hypothetical protein